MKALYKGNCRRLEEGAKICSEETASHIVDCTYVDSGISLLVGPFKLFVT